MKHKSLIPVLAGAALFVLGFFLLRQDLALPLPYVCIGVGCGLFGHGMGEILSRKAIEKYPEIQKQIEIEQKDERTVAIANMAKAKAFDAMLFLFGALMLSYGLMQADLAVILLLVAAYLFIVGYYVYFQCKFTKEF